MSKITDSNLCMCVCVCLCLWVWNSFAWSVCVLIEMTAKRSTTKSRNLFTSYLNVIFSERGLKLLSKATLHLEMSCIVIFRLQDFLKTVNLMKKWVWSSFLKKNLKKEWTKCLHSMIEWLFSVKYQNMQQKILVKMHKKSKNRPNSS